MPRRQSAVDRHGLSGYLWKGTWSVIRRWATLKQNRKDLATGRLLGVTTRIALNRLVGVQRVRAEAAWDKGAISHVVLASGTIFIRIKVRDAESGPPAAPVLPPPAAPAFVGPVPTLPPIGWEAGQGRPRGPPPPY